MFWIFPIRSVLLPQAGYALRPETPCIFGCEVNVFFITFSAQLIDQLNVVSEVCKDQVIRMMENFLLFIYLCINYDRYIYVALLVQR